MALPVLATCLHAPWWFTTPLTGSCSQLLTAETPTPASSSPHTLLTPLSQTSLCKQLPDCSCDHLSHPASGRCSACPMVTVGDPAPLPPSVLRSPPHPPFSGHQPLSPTLWTHKGDRSSPVKNKAQNLFLDLLLPAHALLLFPTKKPL